MPQVFDEREPFLSAPEDERPHVDLLSFGSWLDDPEPEAVLTNDEKPEVLPAEDDVAEPRLSVAVSGATPEPEETPF